jgi:hypothetical protein
MIHSALSSPELATWSAPAEPWPVQVYEGFDTGTDLAKLSDTQLTAFVEAFLDGLSLAPLLNAPPDCTAQA